MTTTSTVSLADALRPVAPPRTIEGVYTDDEYRRLLHVVQSYGPWQTIVGQTFRSVDELVATSSGSVPKDHGMTLDSIATAIFRGYFAKDSCCYYDELHDVFYNERLLGYAKEYWGAAYAKPTSMLFNLNGPSPSGLSPHLDATTFRGVRIENTPVWLQNIMAKSGLFTDYIVKMAQLVSWFWRGEEGTFTCWPDGPNEPPYRVEHPMWNKGVLAQTELMFHRGDPAGRPDQRPISGLAARSLIEYREPSDEWVVTTDGRPIRAYPPEETRFLVHWTAEVYRDLDEAKKVMDHSDDLTHQRVVDVLLADLRARGVQVAEPVDPLHDPAWIQALTTTYSIAPTIDWIERDPGVRMSD